MNRALARPAMQRRVASLARAHAASTQGSAPHGDQMLVDPSVTAGSASRDAQNFHHADDERRQVFASTASMAVQSSVRTAIDAAAAETLADLDSGSVTALAPGASSPMARAVDDGSTRSADDDRPQSARSVCRECAAGCQGNYTHSCKKRKVFTRGVTSERSTRARRSLDSAPALTFAAGTRVRSARDSTSSKDGADTPVSRPTAAPASAISTTGSSARTTPSSHATESEPGGGTANTPMPDAAELPRAHLAGTAPSAPHTV